MLRYIGLRGVIRILKQSQHQSSSSPLPAASLNNNVSSAANDSTKVELENKNGDSEKKFASENNNRDPGKKLASENLESKVKSKLVSTVFASLKNEEIESAISTQNELRTIISNAKSIDTLLSVVSPKVSRQDALKIVSVLADWTCAGRINSSEFENDKRFLVLCQLLGSSSDGSKTTKPKPVVVPNDLATVLGVTGDDEAAKIIANISLHHMVKVIISLGSKKRRSLPVLRSLAFNIGKSSEKLNIKHGADILYAVAQLNFYDEVLFEKICSDLCGCVMENTKRAVVGSIITSLGLLKYKDRELLDLLSKWTIDNLSTCHTQDVVALLLTLATVNHLPQYPQNIIQKLTEHLTPDDVPSANIWLDVVWSLVVLGQASHQHVTSVLNPEFLEKLSTISSDDISIGTKLKLLNINGAAKLKSKDYTGPFLDPLEEKWKVTIQRSKDKQALVTSVIDTLSNLVPSSVYLLTNIDSGMGFYIDGECLVDAKLTPLPLIDKKTGQPIERSTSRGTKVAILVLDYHDMTRGEVAPTGLASLAKQLTSLQGYKVLTVQYNDFDPRDKLVSRVKYIKELLRTTIQQS